MVAAGEGTPDMRMRDAAVGDVLERTDEHGERREVLVTATRGEARYLPVGIEVEGAGVGYIDIEQYDDWTPVEGARCPDCGAPADPANGAYCPRHWTGEQPRRGKGFFDTTGAAVPRFKL